MPVFNGETYLREAITSILNQTYSNFEFIIINDGSTDKTPEIIKKFNDSRINLLNNQTNIGIIHSLNKGIEFASGEYIARMDADDIALPKRLQTQLNYFIDNPNCKIIGGNYNIITKNKTHSFNHQFTNNQLKTILLFSTCFMHPTVMFKKSDDTIYNSQFKHTEDYELWCRLAINYEFGFCTEKSINYRSHEQQISAQNKTFQLQKSAEIRKIYLTNLGFTFNEKQFETHNFIGDNVFITKKSQLIDIEAWLKNLINQNNTKNSIYQKDFNSIILKFWSDSCGNSNLGFFALTSFYNSEIYKQNKIDYKSHLKLLIKCIIRKFKK